MLRSQGSLLRFGFQIGLLSKHIESSLESFIEKDVSESKKFSLKKQRKAWRTDLRINHRIERTVFRQGCRLHCQESSRGFFPGLKEKQREDQEKENPGLGAAWTPLDLECIMSKASTQSENGEQYYR